MEEAFQILVNYKDAEVSFDAKLLSFTYTYKIEVRIDGWLVWFERDDEGMWRGILKEEIAKGSRVPDAQLLLLITEQLKKDFS